jgi:hypothetical protein
MVSRFMQIMAVLFCYYCYSALSSALLVVSPYTWQPILAPVSLMDFASVGGYRSTNLEVSEGKPTGKHIKSENVKRRELLKN